MTTLVGKRVVVVEDEAQQAEALTTLLRLEGVEAIAETKPQRVLDRFLREPPDAVIVDVVMPEMSGPELVAALRTNQPGLPAVYVTGLEAHDPRVAGALARGLSTYVAKPVRLEVVLDALARLFDAAKDAARLSLDVDSPRWRPTTR